MLRPGANQVVIIYDHPHSGLLYCLMRMNQVIPSLDRGSLRAYCNNVVDVLLVDQQNIRSGTDITARVMKYQKPYSYLDRTDIVNKLRTPENTSMVPVVSHA